LFKVSNKNELWLNHMELSLEFCPINTESNKLLWTKTTQDYDNKMNIQVKIEKFSF